MKITDARMAGVLVRPSIWSAASPAHSRRASSIPSAMSLRQPPSVAGVQAVSEKLWLHGRAVRTDGTRSADYGGAPAGTSEVTSSISKGYEIEGVFNPTKAWRISANAAQQEASAAKPADAQCARAGAAAAMEESSAWPLTLSGGVQAWIRMATQYMTNPLTTAKLRSASGCRNCGSGARTL